VSEETLQLIVLENEVAPVADAELEEEGFAPHGVRSRARSLLGKVEPIDFSRFEKELEKIQGQMGSMFEKVSSEKPAGKFSLDEVSVSLAINGSGNIGIAAVGVEASITLTYKRS
jgi:hypothetical protein